VTLAARRDGASNHVHAAVAKLAVDSRLRACGAGANALERRRALALARNAARKSAAATP